MPQFRRDVGRLTSPGRRLRQGGRADRFAFSCANYCRRRRHVMSPAKAFLGTRCGILDGWAGARDLHLLTACETSLLTNVQSAGGIQPALSKQDLAGAAHHLAVPPRRRAAGLCPPRDCVRWHGLLQNSGRQRTPMCWRRIGRGKRASTDGNCPRNAHCGSANRFSRSMPRNYRGEMVRRGRTSHCIFSGLTKSVLLWDWGSTEDQTGKSASLSLCRRSGGERSHPERDGETRC